MQVLMSPFRFAGQWAMFPFLLILSLAAGAGVGAAHGWGAEQSAVPPSILVDILTSPLPLVLALIVLGLVTNSWTIAIIVGSATAVAAIGAQQLAVMATSSDSSFDPIEVISELPVAILGGAALGLAGCLWHHEQGALRAMGAAMAAGALGWIAWSDLKPASFSLDIENTVGWSAAVLAVAVVARCGLNGTLVLAVIGTVAVAALLLVISDNGATDYRRMVETLLDEVRRWQRDLFGNSRGGRYE